jgi:hypothetical protein
MGSGGCLVIVGILLLVAEPLARRMARAAEADL